MRKVLILGSTGSIGVQAIEIVNASDDLELVGLSAQRSWERLVAQARKAGVGSVALVEPDAARRASLAWPAGRVLSGAAGIERLIVESNAEIVLNAVVGSAGLGPTIVALGEGFDLALANKESLVVGGDLITQLAEGTGARILPVDSEHSALFQLLRGQAAGTVDRLALTASGGPFRGMTPDQLHDVSPQRALAHPTWEMGGKITIDSATLMNKGLELIEAHHLFGFPYEQIEIVVHPESLVHSLIHLIDGASLAHLGYPDMRVPISYALHYPQRAEVPVRGLDLVEVGSLTFEAPDLETFRCLALAREAAAAGGTAPCVLNAANEVAVHAFLNERLAFVDIASVIEGALNTVETGVPGGFEDLYDADGEARKVAGALVARHAVNA